jgi:hypothetical protein
MREARRLASVSGAHQLSTSLPWNFFRAGNRQSTRRQFAGGATQYQVGDDEQNFGKFCSKR